MIAPCHVYSLIQQELFTLLWHFRKFRKCINISHSKKFDWFAGDGDEREHNSLDENNYCSFSTLHEAEVMKVCFLKLWKPVSANSSLRYHMLLLIRTQVRQLLCAHGAWIRSFWHFVRVIQKLLTDGRTFVCMMASPIILTNKYWI